MADQHPVPVFPEERIPAILSQLAGQAGQHYLGQLEQALRNEDLKTYAVHKHTHYYIGTQPEQDCTEVDLTISVFQKPLLCLPRFTLGITQGGELNDADVQASPEWARFIATSRNQSNIYGLLCFVPGLEPKRSPYQAKLRASVAGAWNPLRTGAEDTFTVGTCHPSFLDAVTVHFPPDAMQQQIEIYPIDQQQRRLPENERAAYATHIDRRGNRIVTYIANAAEGVCTNHRFQLKLERQLPI
ncbi:MAG: hypothetical protein HY519_01925 [Candidatus Aenigmarchaeota archaeon]|nr:hypothetical protein [Candidatus Aenigmarchaeota archaeon]